jgi:hypothetical protein
MNDNVLNNAQSDTGTHTHECAHTYWYNFFESDLFRISGVSSEMCVGAHVRACKCLIVCVSVCFLVVQDHNTQFF